MENTDNNAFTLWQVCNLCECLLVCRDTQYLLPRSAVVVHVGLFGPRQFAFYGMHQHPAHPPPSAVIRSCFAGLGHGLTPITE